MEMKEISKKVYEFQKERFSQYGSRLTSELIFLHLTEEIGEIARQIFNKNSKMRDFDGQNLKEEITQSILDLFVLAELNEISLEDSMNSKIEEMKTRYKK